MHILIVNFSLKGISEEEYRRFVEPIAPAFADLPRLVSKTRLADPEANIYGGVYVWENREAMEDYIETNLYFENIAVKDIAVLEGPTRITHGEPSACQQNADQRDRREQT